MKIMMAVTLKFVVNIHHIKLQNAFEQYDSAIRAARDHKFVHEEGLANAAAAKCCLHYGKKKKAMIYYAQAKDCYGRWGANALVSRIEEICRKL